MVYKFDEYVEAFPKKNVSTLKKFVGEAKNNAEYVAKIDKAFEQLEKVAEPKPDVTGLLEALKYVDVAISEVDKIKVNLLGIRAQITKFVK